MRNGDDFAYETATLRCWNPQVQFHGVAYRVDVFDLVNAPVATISDQMKGKLEEKLRTWNHNNRLGDMPTLNLNNWLQRVRRLRVLSTFPMLGELKDTKDLTLTGTEDR